MKKLSKQIFYFSIFVFFALFFSVSRVDAATIGFSSLYDSYKVGDTINVKVYVNAGSKSINAVSANVKYSSDTLSLSSISKTGSIINLWAQEPSSSLGVVSLEGVILSGYSGASGNIATLVFKARAPGTASFSFNSASILANDGNGTEVLSGKGTKSLAILDSSETKVAPIEKKESAPKINKEDSPKKDNTISISEIKNNTSQYSLNKFLINSPQPVLDKTYTIQIDSLPSITWTDDGTHIFQASDISSGEHTIKVMAVDTNSNTLSGFLNFSTTVLRVPVITYYQKEIFKNQMLVVKGNSDPSANIEVTLLNTKTGESITEYVTANTEGEFVFVPENNIVSGVYSLSARATTIGGVSSNYMNPIQIINKEDSLSLFFSKISNYIILLIPFIALIFFTIMMIFYLNHHTKTLKKTLNKRLANAENIVSKSFDLLSEDEDEEVAIFRKILNSRTLDKREALFLDKFKKDIKEAEKIIQKELKEVGKSK